MAPRLPHSPDAFLADVPTVSGAGEPDCTVCLQDFASATCADPVVKLPCGHFFHKSCIATWLRGMSDNSNKCPVCRTLLYEDNRIGQSEALDMVSNGGLPAGLNRGGVNLGGDSASRFFSEFIDYGGDREHGANHTGRDSASRFFNDLNGYGGNRASSANYDGGPDEYDSDGSVGSVIRHEADRILGLIGERFRLDPDSAYDSSSLSVPTLLREQQDSGRGRGQFSSSTTHGRGGGGFGPHIGSYGISFDGYPPPPPPPHRHRAGRSNRPDRDAIARAAEMREPAGRRAAAEEYVAGADAREREMERVALAKAIHASRQTFEQERIAAIMRPSGHRLGGYNHEPHRRGPHCAPSSEHTSRRGGDERRNERDMEREALAAAMVASRQSYDQDHRGRPSGLSRYRRRRNTSSERATHYGDRRGHRPLSDYDDYLTGVLDRE